MYGSRTQSAPTWSPLTGCTSSPLTDCTWSPLTDCTWSPLTVCTSSPLTGYTWSPLTGYTWSPLTGYTWSPLTGYTWSPLTVCTNSPLTGCPSSPLTGYTWSPLTREEDVQGACLRGHTARIHTVLGSAGSFRAPFRGSIRSFLPHSRLLLLLRHSWLLLLPGPTIAARSVPATPLVSAQKRRFQQLQRRCCIGTVRLLHHISQPRYSQIPSMP
jgi:hypothetical protein